MNEMINYVMMAKRRETPGSGEVCTEWHLLPGNCGMPVQRFDWTFGRYKRTKIMVVINRGRRNVRINEVGGTLPYIAC